MKKNRRLRGLLAVLALSTLTSLSARAEELNLRGDVQLDASVVQAFENGRQQVDVIVVAHEQVPVQGFLGVATDPITARRQRADENTREIVEILRSGLDSFTASEAERPMTYLWACNAIATTVDPETLQRLQESGTVAKVFEDRYIQWLPFEDLRVGPLMNEPRGQLYGAEKIRADEANEQGLTGEGVVVGVIDTGADGQHPALAGRILGFKDFTGSDETEAYDDQGHGTHCAGTIAGEMVGMAPAARLLVAKALGGSGGGSLSSLLEAMQWMLDPDGDPATDDQPALVSSSWGADRNALGDSAEVFRDIVKAWREAGIVPVFASGNSGLGSEAVPGGYPEAFAVGATDSRDKVAYFSTGGETVWQGETYIKPDVSAPGVQILSSVPGGKYRAMDGTSMACPHVAGALALLVQARPDASVDELQEAFELGAVDLGTPGKDVRYGEGRIDVIESLGKLAASQP